MRESDQIFEVINTGLVVLNNDFTASGWNRWVEHHSGIQEGDIGGRQLLDFYPNLSEPKYKRFIKSVLPSATMPVFLRNSITSCLPLKTAFVD